LAAPIGRRTGLAFAGVAALGVVGGAAWIGYTARSALEHLSTAADAIPQVRQAWVNGDQASGTAPLGTVQAEAKAAFGKTHDPVWTVAAKIPVLGSPAETVRGLTESVHELTTVSMPQLAAASAVADPAGLVSSPGTVDVAKLASLAPQLQLAAASLAQEEAHVAALPESWFPPVGSARQQLLDELAPVSQQAHAASTAVELIPPMLGGTGTRRYFLAFQNPAEARGTGGLLDAFAILSASNGKVTIDRVGSNGQLPELPDTVPGIDQTYFDRYGGAGALRLWVSSNLSPDFPEVARAWSAMWKASTGETVDGVISVDPQALSAVLAATGPVTAPTVGMVDAARVTPLVLTDQYRLFPAEQVQTADRKSLMLGVGTAAIDRLLSGQADNKVLVDGLTAAAKADHINVFSAKPAEQEMLESAKVAGQVPRTSGPFAQAVVVNSAGTKLDTYLHQDTHYQVTRCGTQDREVRVTVKLTNQAPASGLPSYVTTWAEGITRKPGTNKVTVQVLLSRASAVRTATLDGVVLPLPAPIGTLPTTLPGGKTSFLDQGIQADRPSYGLDVTLPPGGTRTLVMTATEPASSAAPILPLQPMVNPPTVSADISACT
jgi:hypothetical protein